MRIGVEAEAWSRGLQTVTIVDNIPRRRTVNCFPLSCRNYSDHVHGEHGVGRLTVDVHLSIVDSDFGPVT